MNILGIETSCDETGIAVYSSSLGLISTALHTQAAMHAQYGGVVPELASRDHTQRILPLIQAALDKAGLALQDIDAIAYTAGPGLQGALLVGACVAKSMAYAQGIPAIAIHHMEGHLLAALLEDPKPAYPFLALLVSGGHTLLVRVQAFGQYEVLGESLDDAAGEAFDKTAKLLGLPYPGGPHLAKLAMSGNPNRFALPRPMLDRPNLEFSFSGLKTAVAELIRREILTAEIRADIAASFEAAVVETLVGKCLRAIKQTGLSSLVVAGGVSANLRLREALQQIPATVYFPRLEFCTDNGAMIAYAGWLRLQHGCADLDLAIQAKARWSLAEIEEPRSS